MAPPARWIWRRSTSSSATWLHSQHRTLLAFGLVFMIVGIGFKFGAAPFHMWIPDVYQGAPTAMIVFVGSAPKLAAFGMAYRLLEGAMGGMHAALDADAERAGGAFARDRQRRSRSRRRTSSACSAYSTISHIGFLLLGFVNGTPAGYAAAMFYAISYALMATGRVRRDPAARARGFRGRGDRRLQGPQPAQSVVRVHHALAMFSLAGVPPLFGFFAKAAWC